MRYPGVVKTADFIDDLIIDEQLNAVIAFKELIWSKRKIGVNMNKGRTAFNQNGFAKANDLVIIKKLNGDGA